MSIREMCQGCHKPVGSLNLDENKRCVNCNVDMVNHPPHYNNSKAVCQCGIRIECITITRHMGFNVGNAVKYLWRFMDKGGLEDLKKARWYLEDQIKQMEPGPLFEGNVCYKKDVGG